MYNKFGRYLFNIKRYLFTFKGENWRIHTKWTVLNWVDSFFISLFRLEYYTTSIRFNDYSVWERPLLRVSKVVFDTGCNSLCHWEKGFFPIGCMKGWERGASIIPQEIADQVRDEGEARDEGSINNEGLGKCLQWGGLNPMGTTSRTRGYQWPGQWALIVGPMPLNCRRLRHS